MSQEPVSLGDFKSQQKEPEPVNLSDFCQDAPELPPILEHSPVVDPVFEEPQPEPAEEQPQQVEAKVEADVEVEGIWHQALEMFGLAKPKEAKEPPKQANQEPPKQDVQQEQKQAELEAKPVAASVVMAIPVALPVQPEKKVVSEYPDQFELLKQMGFSNEPQINLLLKQNRGDVQATALALLDQV